MCCYFTVVGVKCMAGTGAWRKQHGGLALVQYCQVLSYMRGLEILWNEMDGNTW
jgi:hypothetical protein